MANFDDVQDSTYDVGFLYPWHVPNVCTNVGTVNASTRVVQLQLDSATHFQILRVALQRNRLCLAQNPIDTDSTSFRLRLRFRVGSQPITQTTRSKLDSVVRELVAYRSTSAAERDDVASAAHFLELCCRVLLGAI